MKLPETQTKRLDYLLDTFLDELEPEEAAEVPQDDAGKRQLLRALMNVRAPGEIPEEVRFVQDAYLKERAKEKGIVDALTLPTVDTTLHSTKPFSDRIALWQGDITRLKIGAIVNAANSQMLGCFVPGHNCIDNCIHTYAGVQLRSACDAQMKKIRARLGERYEQPTSIPMMTDAYNLPADKVVHIVGPIITGEPTKNQEEQLAACYRNTLALCERRGVTSVAFCCISTGVFHFPQDKAAEIAVKTVRESLNESKSITRVLFNVFGDADLNIYSMLL